MAVYFEIKDSYIGEDYIKVRVYGLSVGDTVRVFCRLKSDTSDVSWDEKGTYSGSNDYYLETIYDLEKGTTYLVNVMVNPTGTASDTWIGSQEVTTEGKLYTIYLSPEGGSGGTEYVEVEVDEDLPSITIPTKSGYVFKGYFTQTGGNGVQYYDQYGEGTSTYDGSWDSITIFAYWQEAGTAFAWTNEKVAGEPFNLTATEWNALADFVNSKRSRAYSFTVAVKGNDFTAAMYNEMVDAIGEGTEVDPGDPITADLMNELVTNANNM